MCGIVYNSGQDNEYGIYNEYFFGAYSVVFNYIFTNIVKKDIYCALATLQWLSPVKFQPWS